jgi:hypothetical protein
MADGVDIVVALDVRTKFLETGAFVVCSYQGFNRICIIRAAVLEAYDSLDSYAAKDARNGQLDPRLNKTTSDADVGLLTQLRRFDPQDTVLLLRDQAFRLSMAFTSWWI